tara:strand:- start:1836 stop:2009 length:174 start_codon:yes stop_codon:yes gene_type:complete
MAKANKVYARIGFSDIVVPLEDALDNSKVLIGKESFIAGYEDEDGNECHADGEYLNN